MENLVDDGSTHTPMKRKHDDVRATVGYDQQISRERKQPSLREDPKQCQPSFKPAYNSTCAAPMVRDPFTGPYDQRTIPTAISSTTLSLPGTTSALPVHDPNAVETSTLVYHTALERSPAIPGAVQEMSSEDRDRDEDLSTRPQGTHHNPLEIGSSPEQAPRRNPKKGKRKSFYAVAAGHVPGIYKNWEDVQMQIKGYSGAKQQGFMNETDAQAWLEDHIVFSKPPLSCGGLGKKSNNFTFTQQLPTSIKPTTSAQLAERSLFPPGGLAEPSILHDMNVQNQSSISGAESFRAAIERAALSNVENEIPFEPEPVLRPEQQKVVDLILQGHNVFYTGSAGCGKSTILKAIVKQLQNQGKQVKIVAPTNLAALNVGGVTTWSYAGWTPDSMKRPLEKLKQAAHGKEVYERFSSTDVLVIDEISMVENLLFERLNHIMSASRGTHEPFGGVQLVVTGDFCQLSPVRPFQHCIGCGWELQRDHNYTPKEYRCENKYCSEDVFYDIDKWAFRSKAWEQCDFQHINLTEIHRQSDRKFISILQKIRTDGIILPPHANVLLHHTSETEGAIQLFARRLDVDRINNESIARLPHEARTYKCVDHFDWKSHHRSDTTLEKNNRQATDGTLIALREHRYEVFVQLKENMRVVLQANLEPASGLVNGAQGTITGFEEFSEARLPRKTEKRNDTFGLQVTRGEHAAYLEAQIRIFAHENNRQPWPIVQFDNGVKRTIFADCTTNELGNEEPYSVLSRTQIPLMAGYAITVHKSQGMTLDRVIVDLSRAFEPSQIYVALSRARSLMGLKVLGLPRSNLGGANEQVKEFFQKYLLKK